MRIGVPSEIYPDELRVAATPDTVRTLVRTGHACLIESGAGLESNLPDAAFLEAGATIAQTAAQVYAASDLVLKVRGPEAAELALIRPGSALVGLLSPHDVPAMEALARTGVTAFAMDAMPRISRAQAMDALSSQASVAGYRAVLLAAVEYRRFMPTLMTAAGTVKAARVLVLGAGVAGLQAIATARRLGAIVEAFDVRPAVRQEVESLGAKFVDVSADDDERAGAQTAQGYAREMSDTYRRRQQAVIAERASAADIVITAAFVPGRPAPRLVSDDTVARMKPGSVIVDLGVEQGGNCALTERDRVVLRHGVRIVGLSNLPSQVAADASALYARNLLNFVHLLTDDAGGLMLNRTDDIIAATLVCAEGKRVPPAETTA